MVKPRRLVFRSNRKNDWILFGALVLWVMLWVGAWGQAKTNHEDTWRFHLFFGVSTLLYLGATIDKYSRRDHFTVTESGIYGGWFRRKYYRWEDIADFHSFQETTSSGDKTSAVTFLSWSLRTEPPVSLLTKLLALIPNIGNLALTHLEWNDPRQLIGTGRHYSASQGIKLLEELRQCDNRQARQSLIDGVWEAAPLPMRSREKRAIDQLPDEERREAEERVAEYHQAGRGSAARKNEVLRYFDEMGWKFPARSLTGREMLTVGCVYAGLGVFVLLLVGTPIYYFADAVWGPFGKEHLPRWMQNMADTPVERKNRLEAESADWFQEVARQSLGKETISEDENSARSQIRQYSRRQLGLNDGHRDVAKLIAAYCWTTWDIEGKQSMGRAESGKVWARQHLHQNTFYYMAPEFFIDARMHLACLKPSGELTSADYASIKRLELDGFGITELSRLSVL
ncbi:MAG: hypothetical protein OSB47_10200, partial [Pirellulaceae bacterium]|nr:hypothetical protein [Pirellulaceae bacterium]